MDTVICLLTMIPIRLDPSHRSEQTSQLLFGEKAEIVDHKDQWIKIKTFFDSYSGWIEYNSVVKIERSGYNRITMITTEPLSNCQYNGNNFQIAAGSEIPMLNHDKTFCLGGNSYRFLGTTSVRKENSRSDILTTALKFINSPYVWGGRTALGIDCSGFTQIVFKIHGINLPRDAKDQSKIGVEVDSLSEILPGDLIFFNNEEGAITHVGIAMNSEQLIHASVSVRIDKLDEKGIYNQERKEYSHSLKLIRRLL